MEESVEKFHSFMKKHKVEKGEEKGRDITHTFYGKPYGSYIVDDEETDKFLSLYSKALRYYDKNNMETELHVIERQKRVGPLLIDIDFKQKSSSRKYTFDHVKKVIELFTKYARKYVKISDEHLETFLFEKEEPSIANDLYKDGFHVVYPYLVLDASIKYLLTEKVCEEAKKLDIFEDISVKNTYDEIFDTTVVYRNGWLMYGSRKKDGQRYSLTKILDHDLTKNEETPYKQAELVKLLCLRQHDKQKIEINSEYDNADFKKYLENKFYENNPKEKKKLNLSNEFKEAKRKTDDDDISDNTSVNDIKINVDEKPKQVYAPAEKLAEIELAKKLANILSPKRASSYATWINVGWALHNIDGSLLSEFTKFSKKSPNKYEKGCCEKIWDQARNDGYTISSLHWWAKEDSPNEYKKILRELVHPLIEKAKSGTHVDIAILVQQFYGHIYRCAGIKTKAWYEFKDHRWNKIESGCSLETKISDDLTKEFAALAGAYASEAATKEGTQERDALFTSSKSMFKIIDKLKNNGFLAGLMDSCSKRFYDPTFEKKLNERKELLGFKNGVYDFKSGHFRAGSPDDYISLTTDIEYKEFKSQDDAKNHPHYSQIHKFFDEVMTNKEMKDYVLTLTSTFLTGECKEQSFLIWTGVGANGKSTCINLISYSMGEYFATIPTTILTKKRGSSSSATPELADKHGKRLIVVQEPEHDDTIYVGNMKQLTGCDWVEARALYGNPFKYKPQFKVLLTCNKLPYVPSNDNGTWRRVKATPWESEFVKNPDPMKPKQFKCVKDLDHKLVEWAPMFMWILINEYYPIYAKHGLSEPSKVTEHTDKYKQDSDIFHEFIKASFVATKEKTRENEVTLNEMFEDFKIWYRGNYGKPTEHARKVLIEYLTNSGYNIEGDYAYGFKEKVKTNKQQTD
jgi:P4 family phage/plasmid primase-like protien